MEYEFDILYYVNFFKRWKLKIIIAVGVSMFFAGLLTMFSPIYYTSEVTLIEPGTTTRFSSLEKWLGLPSDDSGGSPVEAFLYSRRMANDIREEFGLDEMPKFRYSIFFGKARATRAIVAKATDPVLSQKIANFAARNLTKINEDLNISSKKPMVTILDEARSGRSESRGVIRKAFMAGLAAFMIVCLYGFFTDYHKHLKKKGSR